MPVCSRDTQMDHSGPAARSINRLASSRGARNRSRAATARRGVDHAQLRQAAVGLEESDGLEARADGRQPHARADGELDEHDVGAGQHEDVAVAVAVGVVRGDVEHAPVDAPARQHVAVAELAVEPPARSRPSRGVHRVTAGQEREALGRERRRRKLSRGEDDDERDEREQRPSQPAARQATERARRSARRPSTSRATSPMKRVFVA